MARQFSFKNPVTGKGLVPKKPKPQKLCGWEIDEEYSQSLEKLKHVPEYAKYKYLPKQRCGGFEDEEKFEKESLHDHFNPKTVINEKPDSDTINSSQRVDTLPKETPQRSNVREGRVQTACTTKPNEPERPKTRDDMDLLYKENTSENTYFSKNSKSVPFVMARSVTDLDEGRSPTMRRMLYYARKYASKDEMMIDEEEDEGYDSKTPSEEKEMKLFDTPLVINNWGAAPSLKYQHEVGKILTHGERLAKFSYTHQTSRPFYRQFEDDAHKDFSHTPRTLNDVNNQSMQHLDHMKTNVSVSTKLERSHTVLGSKNESCSVLDDKPASIILRKISIQNSHKNRNDKSITQETKYELQNPMQRSHTICQEQNHSKERVPLGCISSDLKVSSNQQKSPSRVTQKLKIESGRLAYCDVLQKTHAGIFELQRSHTSVCMPIGDLLPVAENFHNKSSFPTTATDPDQSIPSTSREQPEETPRVVSIEDDSLDCYSVNKSNTLCSSPFRQTKSSQESIGRKKQNVIELYPHPASAMQASTREPRTRLTQTKPKDGLPSGSFLPKLPTLVSRRRKIPEKKPETTTLEVSLAGIDIEIKQEFKAKLRRATTIGKIKLSSNPDRDTKKKLRDAFSRFYNKHAYAPDRNVNWSEDLRFVWNTS